MYKEALKKANYRKEINNRVDGVKGLLDGFAEFFNNSWLMFLIFVLLVIGCGGCFGGVW